MFSISTPSTRKHGKLYSVVIFSSTSNLIKLHGVCRYIAAHQESVFCRQPGEVSLFAKGVVESLMHIHALVFHLVFLV